MNKILQIIGDIIVIVRIAFRQTGLNDTVRLRNALLSQILPLGALFVYQLMFCWIKNIFDWDLTWITVILSLVVVFFVVRGLFGLRRLLSLGIIGEGLEALGLAPAEYPTSRLFLAYWNLATALLFWELAISFLLPFADLSQNPLIGISLLLGVTAYIIVYPKGEKIKKATTWGIVVIMALMITELVFTPALCIKLVGADPFSAMRISIADKALAKALKADKEDADKKVAARLDEITEKRNRGVELSEADKKLFEEQRGKGLISGMFAPSAAAKTPSPGKSPEPKKEIRQYTKNFPLEFLGAEHIVDRGPGWVKIQKKTGRANFLVADIPLVKGAKYKITFHATRKITGKDYLLINAGKGNHGRPFFYKNHPASDMPMEITFFKEGMAGNSEYFYPTDNFFQLSADDDDDLLVQLDKPHYVEITYWE